MDATDRQRGAEGGEGRGGRGDEEEDKEEKEEEEEETDIKFNNPHLTGGELNKKFESKRAKRK